MSDIAIKLFGRTIALPATLGAQVDEDKDHPNKEETTIVSKNREEEPPNTEDKKDQKPSDDDEGTASGKTSKPQEEQNDSSNSQEKNDSSNSQEKPLKKPDKLVPCPRCNSLETKFCYYNNYNVNQPRHFCKNCQRYWTDGGTMRNVPVGAGRRKNKSSIASQYCHLTISDGTKQDIHEHIHHPHLKPNGTVLSFGSDTPLSESIASVLNLANKNHQNGFHSMEEQSSVSSVTASTSNDEDIRAKLKEPGIQNCQGFTPQVPYLNGSPWPLPWIPPTNNMPASTFPMPFYPSQSYWGCTPWGLPWLSPLSASSVTSGSLGSIPNSATLGKHAREGDVHPRNSSSEAGEERNRVWLPKTLRIADPEEAAKNSIWASMGFKSDKADATGGGQGFFRPFQKKGEIRAHLPEALHANPAALSRSISFQESS